MRKAHGFPRPQAFATAKSSYAPPPYLERSFENDCRITERALQERHRPEKSLCRLGDTCVRFKLSQRGAEHRRPVGEARPRSKAGKGFAHFRAACVAPVAAGTEADGTDVVALHACSAALDDDSDHVEMNFRKYHEMGTDRTMRLMQFGRRRQDVACMRCTCGGSPQRLH